MKIVPSFLIAFGYAVLMTSCGGDAQSAANDSHDGETSPLTIIHGVGYVEPLGEVRRLVFRHPGIVDEVVVEEGTLVEENQVLMRQRNVEELADLATAEAMLSVAQAELDLTLAGVHPARIDAAKAEQAAAIARKEQRESELQRQQVLSEKGAGVREKLDAAHSLNQQAIAELAAIEAEVDHLKNHLRDPDRALAEARVQAATAQREAARTRLAETELRAPMAGRVLDVLHRPGDASGGTLSGNQPACLIGDTSTLMVRAEIDENFALLILPGQAVTVLTPGRDAQTLSGSVAEIKPLMGRKTVFSRSATERRDIDVLQVLIDLDTSVEVPVGLKVDVEIQAGAP